jgi:cytochrome b involved in lipid metabolism
MHTPRTVKAVLLTVAIALPLAACSASATPSATGAATPTASASVASPSPGKAPTTAETTTSPSATPKPTSTVKTYSMAQVKTHDSASSCWSVVDGNVYDLTRWIGKHPGGRARILQMCGKDGTAAFRGEHGRERGPNNDLKAYRIGELA